MGAETPPTFSAAQLLEALQLTGRLLDERDEQYEVVVIGGANLALQNLVDRLTVDVDVVAVRDQRGSSFTCAQPLPSGLAQAVDDVAQILRMPSRWLNGAASSDFALGLPRGYESRLDSRQYGGLTVSLADRGDIVAWKLQAAVDNVGLSNRHLDDLRALRPSLTEIEAARMWFSTVEMPKSGFWSNLEHVLEALHHG